MEQREENDRDGGVEVSEMGFKGWNFEHFLVGLSERHSVSSKEKVGVGCLGCGEGEAR